MRHSAQGLKRLTSRAKGCSQSRELLIFSCNLYQMCVTMVATSTICVVYIFVCGSF